MKKTAFLATALAALVASAFANAATSSYDGKITFNGKVVDNTCVVKTSMKDLTVKLPTVSTTSLSTAGSTTGDTAFSIDLEQCQTGANKGNTVRLFFQPANAAHFNSNNSRSILTNQATGSSVASNVGIQILTSTKDAVPVGKDINAYTQTTDKVALGSNVQLNYFARYYATGTATAGDVQAAVEYSIVYD